MLWIAVTVVLGIIGLGALFVALGSKTGEKAMPGLVSAGCLVVWLVVSFFMSIHNVGQRQVGIVYNFSGTITGRKAPGTVLTAPWQHIKTENVGVQKELFDFGSDNAAVSKDQQPITAKLLVNYQVTPADALQLFKTVGPGWRVTLLDGRVPQDFKETTAEFTSPEITLKRPALRTKTLDRLRGELCPKTAEEPFCVNVLDVFVSNVGYSKAYTDAIEAKQVQVQQALQAVAKVAQATAEAHQKVASARGEAAAIALKGRALAAHPEILRLEAIDKLNPNATVVICTGQTCPSFLPSGLVNGK